MIWQFSFLNQCGCVLMQILNHISNILIISVAKCFLWPPLNKGSCTLVNTSKMLVRQLASESWICNLPNIKSGNSDARRASANESRDSEIQMWNRAEATMLPTCWISLLLSKATREKLISPREVASTSRGEINLLRLQQYYLDQFMPQGVTSFFSSCFILQVSF